MIGEAVEAYLASLEDLEAPVARPSPFIPERERAAPSVVDDVDDAWFDTFDESAHVAYEDAPPTRRSKVAAWLGRARAA